MKVGATRANKASVSAGPARHDANKANPTVPAVRRRANKATEASRTW
jgi:hypothetical protein